MFFSPTEYRMTKIYSILLMLVKYFTVQLCSNVLLTMKNQFGGIQIPETEELKETLNNLILSGQ